MKIFIHEGTHWDREWYRTFEGFRIRLVEMLDDLIERMEKDENLKVFHLDGQIVPLEDYLEIRPEMRDRLYSLIRAGRIIIGPWYCMPDEFLVSGESIIANLRRGMKEARMTYGVEPCKNAYICDIFGHSAQTPQIFDGLGLNHTVLGRGTNSPEFATHFRWQALDGSFVTAYRLLEDGGYNDFTKILWKVSLDDRENFRKTVKEYVDGVIEKSNIPVITLFESGDHSGLLDLNPYIEALQEIYPDAEIYWTNIEEMNKAEDCWLSQLPVHIGEIDRTTRQGNIEEIMGAPGPFCYLIPNTASSRYILKKLNDINQTTLEKKVRPLYGLGLINRPRGFVSEIEKNVLLNHPHDSICGCSIDEVHRDMLYRFNKAKYISDELIDCFVRERIGCDSEGGKRILRLYNWLPYRLSKTLSVDIDFAPDFPRFREGFGYQFIPAFKLTSADGREIPYGITDIVHPDGLDVQRCKVTFSAELLPMGVTEYNIEKADRCVRYPEKLTQSLRGAENCRLKIDFNLDGTFNLLDKKTGETYYNLLSLKDEGEIGDGWFHSSPIPNTTAVSSNASVEICENNCERITFAVRQSVCLPKEIDRSHGFHRSEQRDTLEILHKVSLSKTDEYLDIHTVIDNNIRDHRLKIVLPTGVKGDKYYLSEAFGMVERPRDDNLESADWKEFEAAEKQTEGIVFTKDKNRGLAFVSDYGIHECAVRTDGDIEMTFIRAFSQTVSPSAMCEDCENIGKNEYHFQIVPLSMDEEYSYLRRIADICSCEPLSVTANGNGAEKCGEAVELCRSSLIFSTLDVLENGEKELRFFNASSKTDTATVLLPDGVTKASLTKIDGRPLKELTVDDRRITFEITPWKIYTVKYS